jgi:putative transposase
VALVRPYFCRCGRNRRIEGMKSSRLRWHPDEKFAKINGELQYLWRAVDHEDEVLKNWVTEAHDKKKALKNSSKTMRKHG